MWLLKLCWQNLDPVVIGIVDKVETHIVILVAEATHLAVVLTDGGVVAFD